METTTEVTVDVLLDQLADYQAERDALMLERQEALKKVLTPEIEQQILDIEVEFAGKAEGVNKKIKAKEDEVKKAVLKEGKTASGKFLQAVWMPPKVSWDTGKLEAMGALIPEILVARKVGNPFVTIRKR